VRGGDDLHRLQLLFLLLFCLARFFFGMPESDVMVKAVISKNNYLKV